MSTHHLFSFVCCCLVLGGGTLSSQGNEHVMDEPAILSYDFHTHGYEDIATGELVPSDDAEAGEVMEIKVLKKPKQDWHVVMSGKNDHLVELGDVIRFTAKARSLREGENALISLCAQTPKNNFHPLKTVKGGGGAKFEETVLLLKAEDDYAPGELVFNVFAGAQPQEIQVADITAVKLGAGEETIAEKPEGYRFDFTEAFTDVQPPKETKSQISGQTPKGWYEDSHWADVTINHQRVEEGRSEPFGAWRIDLQKIRQGSSLQRIDNFPASSEFYKKIKIAMKTPTSTPVMVGIRNSKNYKTYWEKTVTPNPEWREFEFLVPPLPEDDEAQFILWLKRPGVLDIDSIEISYATASELGLPNEMEGNLLANSSFPFGLPPLWNAYSKTYRPENMTVDRENLGPTGQPALKWKGIRDEQHLNTAFKAQGGKKHTLSVWAKTDQPGTELSLRMSPPSEKIYEAPYNSTHFLTKDWKRYHFTVELPFSVDGFYQTQLRMRSGDTVWLDGIMVEPGDKPGKFQRAAPVELTLAAESDFSPWALYFPGQEMKLKVQGLGKVPAGANLVSSVQYFNGGEAINLPEVTLEAGQFPETVLTIPPQGLPPLGSYRVDVQVKGPKGEPLSRPSSLLMHRVREPRMAGKFAPDSPFGIHSSPLPGLDKVVKGIGANWVRSFHMGWNMFQRGSTAKSVWDWKHGDRLINGYHDNHLLVMMPLSHPPRWATYAPEDLRSYRVNMFVPREDQLDLWADYARKMATRYKGKIQAFETWNEPFFRAFNIYKMDENGEWVQSPPEHFVEMSRVASAAIREANPDAKVLWNLGGLNEPHYDQAVAKLDIWDLIDGVAYHNYDQDSGGFPGDRFEGAIDPVKALLAQYGHRDMPIWNSEGGPGGSHFHFFFPQGPARDTSAVEDQTSTYLARSYTRMLVNGVSKFFLYAYYYSAWRGDYLFLQPDGRLAPNATAYSNLAWHLEGKNYVATVPIQDGAWHLYVFADEKDSAALLVPRTSDSFQLPDGVRGVLTVSDLYGNPVAQSTLLKDAWFYGEGVKPEALAAALGLKLP